MGCGAGRRGRGDFGGQNDAAWVRASCFEHAGTGIRSVAGSRGAGRAATVARSAHRVVGGAEPAYPVAASGAGDGDSVGGACGGAGVWQSARSGAFRAGRRVCFQHSHHCQHGATRTAGCLPAGRLPAGGFVVESGYRGGVERAHRADRSGFAPWSAARRGAVRGGRAAGGGRDMASGAKRAAEFGLV